MSTKQFIILLILGVLFITCYTYYDTYDYDEDAEYEDDVYLNQYEDDEYEHSDEEDEYEQPNEEYENSYEDELILELRQLQFLKKQVKKLKKKAKKLAKKVEDSVKNDVKDAVIKAGNEIEENMAEVFKHIKTWAELWTNEAKLVKDEISLTDKMSITTTTPHQKYIESISGLLVLGYIYNSDTERLDMVTGGFGKDWENLQFVQPDKFITVQIIRNTKMKILIVGFRGTDGTREIWNKKGRDWLKNLTINLKSSPYGKGKVHAGFLSEVQVLMKQSAFVNTVVSHMNQGYEVVFTGHSQGAAEAAIAASAFLNIVAKPNVQIVLFASPRPGNEAFAKDLMIKIPRIVRYEAGTGKKQDLVTQLGMRVWAYHHVGKRVIVPCSTWSLDCHRPSWYYQELEKRHPMGYTQYPIIPKWAPQYCAQKGADGKCKKYSERSRFVDPVPNPVVDATSWIEDQFGKVDKMFKKLFS